MPLGKLNFLKNPGTISQGSMPNNVLGQENFKFFMVYLGGKKERE